MVWDYFRGVLGRRSPGMDFLSRDAVRVFRAVSPIELVRVGRTHERTCISAQLRRGAAAALPAGTFGHDRIPAPDFSDPPSDFDRLAPLLFGVWAAMERAAVR